MKDQNVDRKLTSKTSRSKFRSLILDKNFEEAKDLSLEELNDNTCKYMEGHPNEKTLLFVAEKQLRNFHIVLAFNDCLSAKRQEREIAIKEGDMPAFLEKSKNSLISKNLISFLLKTHPQISTCKNILLSLDRSF